MTNNYICDPVTRVYSRLGGKAFTYTDGEEVETRLLTAIEKAQDLSAASTELANEIVDWPSEYHLSNTRHNLLRPISIGPRHRVLELGCGCGAMTRYLGETGATVVAVEGSARRAQIAASRCRDLENVSVFCENLIDFLHEEKFDYVTLIGVLEYAPIFVESDDPVNRCLNYACSSLRPSGTLILAIENQLGLKYFSGCSEDHTGIPFFGINNLYQSGGPVTFGRHVLSEKLRKAGFPNLQFFYPFPDYKLPGLILSESALASERLNIADLLLSNSGRDYPESYQRTFAEDLAWHTVIGNRLLRELANSLLVLANPAPAGPLPAPNWLAKLYNSGKRPACYQVETTIQPADDGPLFVSKRIIHPDAAITDGGLRHVVQDSPYREGSLLTGTIRTAMAREASCDDIAACFAPWLRFLLAHSHPDRNGLAVLPGNFIDCIPSNFIVSPTGEVHYFDPEWVSEAPVPLAWVATRGIVYALIGCLDNRNLRQMTYRQFISAVAEKNGLHIDAEDFATADRLEAGMVAQCQLDATSTPKLAEFLDAPLLLVLPPYVPELRRALDWHQAELDRIKHTVSWRVTAPLRVVWNFALRLVGRHPAAKRLSRG